MARQVVWSQTALNVVNQAAAYVAMDSPGYASTLVKTALEIARGLDRHSER